LLSLLLLSLLLVSLLLLSGLLVTGGNLLVLLFADGLGSDDGGSTSWSTDGLGLDLANNGSLVLFVGVGLFWASTLALWRWSLLAVLATQGVRVGEVLGILVDALSGSLEFIFGFVVVVSAKTAGLSLVLASDHDFGVLSVVQDLEVLTIGFNDGDWVDCVRDGLSQVDADIVLGSGNGQWSLEGQLVSASINGDLEEVLLSWWSELDLSSRDVDCDSLGVGLMVHLLGKDRELFVWRAILGDQVLASVLWQLVGDVVEGSDEVFHQRAAVGVVVTSQEIGIDFTGWQER